MFFKRKLNIVLNLDGVKRANKPKQIIVFKATPPQIIKELAYYLAEKDNFKETPEHYWFLAEKHVNKGKHV